MKKWTCYLSGINSDDSKETNDWRLTAKEWLENCDSNYNVEVINPDDSYTYLSTSKSLFEKEIIQENYNKIRKSDLVLVNLNKVSLESTTEIQFAFDNGIPIIGYVDGFEVYMNSLILYNCEKVFVGLQATLNYIKDNYLL